MKRGTHGMLNHFGRLAAVAIACAVATGVAQACPVCMLADPKTSRTYLGMTLMMSALPLGLLGGLIYWLKRRYSQPPALRASAPSQPHSAAGLAARTRA